MNLLVVSNMYPSAKAPYYGTFVKTFFDFVKEANDGPTRLLTMYGRRGGALSKLRDYAKFYLHLTATLLTTRADLVYVHTVAFPMPAVFAAKILRPSLKFAFNAHGTDVKGTGRLNSFFKTLARKVLPRAEMIVVPSEYFREVVKDTYPGIRAERIFVSPSGGIPDMFFAETPRHGHAASPPNIGMVSRIDPGKGTEVFIRALAILHNAGIKFNASVTGRGSETERMEQLASELDIQEYVQFEGPCDYNLLPGKYSQVDVLVFPTLLDESLGLVGLEAMAGGCPAIVSDNAGPATYVADGIDGYRFVKGSPEELAVKLRTFMELSPAQRLEMSRNARAKAEKYRTGSVMETLWKKISEIAGR